jgi:DNA-binding beta-propeller fold protein YncE
MHSWLIFCSSLLRITLVFASTTVAATYADPPRYTAVDTVLAAGTLHGPRGIAIDDRTGDLYVTDSKNHVIIRVPLAGPVSVLAGSGRAGFRDGAGRRAEFNEPAGIVFDRAARRLYVTDEQNHAVREVSLSGVTVTLAGNGSRGFIDAAARSAKFDRPAGLAVNNDGSIVYVADAGNNTIRAIKTFGAEVTTIAGDGVRGFADASAAQARFADPQGVATTDDGAVLVCDTANHRIRLVRDGTVTTVAGTRDGYADGATPMFRSPRGIAAEGRSVFIADSGNARIRHLDLLTGLTTTVAGSATTGERPVGGRDGLISHAMFSLPVAVASAGVLFITDEGDNALRAVFPTFGLTEISPRRGSVAGGTVVHISGYGFTPGEIRVQMGDVLAADAVWVNSTTIRIVTPSHRAGTVPIRLATRFGHVSSSIESFTFE